MMILVILLVPPTPEIELMVVSRVDYSNLCLLLLLLLLLMSTMVPMIMLVAPIPEIELMFVSRVDYSNLRLLSESDLRTEIGRAQITLGYH